jgi:hypothetical protein
VNTLFYNFKHRIRTGQTVIAGKIQVVEIMGVFKEPVDRLQWMFIARR